METENKNAAKKKPGFWYSFAVLALVCVVVVVPYILWNISMAAMFFICWVFVVPLCMRLGYAYGELQDAAYQNCRKVVGSIFIIMAMGGMIGAMIACGAVPTVVYVGLKLINPKLFLLCAFAISALYATLTGASWGTLGTLGVAFMLVGAGMNIPPAMTAGAVVSAAYLGDGSSPVSDSTNLASAVIGVDLFGYCKKLYKVVLIAAAINCVLYLVLGLKFGAEAYDATVVNQITSTLSSNFKISIISFLPIAVLLVMLVMQKPALYTLLVSGVIAGLVAVFYQGASVGNVLNNFWSGYQSETGVEIVDKLITRGGVSSLLGSAALFLITFGLIGMMQHVGMLDAITKPLVNAVKTKVSLILTTFGMGFLCNAVGCSGSFSTLINGNLLQPMYKKVGYSNMSLARNLGSVVLPMSPLIPWHINAVMALSLIGVSSTQYWPYVFHAFTMPIVCFVLAMANVDMEKVPAEPAKEVS